MSAFKQRLARIGARAGLLVGASAAVVALSAVGASSAMAATCNGSNIVGEGSSLQATAQGLWTHTYNTACTGEAQAEYKSTSSGTGMAQWGYETGTGQAHTRQYIGTDDAPNATQIGNIKTAAGAGSHVQVVPVAQAAIAIIANPPTGCTIMKITQDELEAVFEGTLTSWTEFDAENRTEHVAGDCDGNVTRIVRKDASGTTYQLKHFLGEVFSGELDCIPGTTWSQIQGGSGNLVWPESCEGTPLSGLDRPAATGGGAVASTVLADPGSIGYVDLATAKAKEATIMEVQNGEGTYASPEAAGGAHEANCQGAPYTVPAAARTTGSGEDVNWSGVYGSALVTSSYPICTLTWDLAFRDYSEAGFGEPNTFGTTVKSFLVDQVLSAEGQAKLEENWYAPLPSTGVAKTDVLDAAQYAAGKIAN